MIWIIAIGVVAVVLFVVLPGVYLLWPTRHEPSSRANLGVSLMTGALVAIAILLIQIVADMRVRDSEERRQHEAERQNLQLTISTQRNLTAIKLEGDLRGFYLYDKILKDAEFADADLTQSVLSRSDLSGATFYSSDGDVVPLDRANLDGVITPTGKVVIRRGSLRDAILSDASLPDAELLEAHLEGADLTRAKLEYAFLTGAFLTGTDLSQARLTGADLTGASLDANTTLDGTDLSRALLVRARLTGVDLRRATLTKDTLLRGAFYDSRTRWPRRFTQPKCPRGKTCRVRS